MKAFKIPAINNELEALKIYLDIDNEDDDSVETQDSGIFKHKNDIYQVAHRSHNLGNICGGAYFNSGIYDIKNVN